MRNTVIVTVYTSVDTRRFTHCPENESVTLLFVVGEGLTLITVVDTVCAVGRLIVEGVRWVYCTSASRGWEGEEYLNTLL